MRALKPSPVLTCALAALVLAASLSSCREPAKKKLPVCPGDPRCEKLLS